MIMFIWCFILVVSFFMMFAVFIAMLKYDKVSVYPMFLIFVHLLLFARSLQKILELK